MNISKKRGEIIMQYLVIDSRQINTAYRTDCGIQ